MHSLEAQVKLSGFFSVVIEPEEWGNLVHTGMVPARKSLPATRLAAAAKVVLPYPGAMRAASPDSQ